MDGKETLFTFGREQQQFDLAALDEVDHLVLIAAGVNVGVSGNLMAQEFMVSRSSESRNCSLNSSA